MKAVKIISIVVAVLIVLVLTLVGTGIYFTNRYLQTPAFKEEVLKAARTALGSDVRIDTFQASLFSGIELRGVTIGNPAGFAGNLLNADAFVLRYRLLPLLSRRVEIEQLSLDKPVITLSQIDKKLAGAGKAGIDNINLSDALFVEKVATSVTLGSDEVKLTPLSGKLADG